MKNKVPVNSITSIIEMNFKFYRLVGLSPFELNASRVRLSKPLCCAVGGFVTFYWTSMVSSIATSDHGNDRISRISNYFQLISNAIMLTTILLSPAFKLRNFAELVRGLRKLEQDLTKASIMTNFRQMTRWNVGIIAGTITFLVLMTSFDCYVTVFKGMIRVDYWIITILPQFINVIAVTQVILLLLYINGRFRLLNQMLQDEQHPVIGRKMLLHSRKPTISTSNEPSKIGLHVIEVPSGGMDNDPMSHLKLPKILYLYNDLYDICKMADRYYGLLFLLTFTSIFIVTTIQLYYSYTILYWFTDENGFTIWSLMVCFNTILINLGVLLTIVLLCEKISNKTKQANDLLSDLQLRGSRQMSSEQIIKLTVPFQASNKVFKFSAMGFFLIDCNMLCGMIGAITTYLVIYIQFYILYADEVKKSTFVSRFQI
ncbi:putative gustatory receptor 2a [Anopheles ziemanni]|uniref:putative gustatory receptor 2a n=1 Tax=Anopheles coustani TaxID=139045 RepID=UPI002657AB64|nr:putative gustatory receptor 2a [Anopheles coustani]XP_058167630.1 putative gustatory receptor 2a [Anopheles ziemanni]